MCNLPQSHLCAISSIGDLPPRFSSQGCPSYNPWSSESRTSRCLSPQVQGSGSAWRDQHLSPIPGLSLPSRYLTASDRLFIFPSYHSRLNALARPPPPSSLKRSPAEPGDISSCTHSFLLTYILIFFSLFYADTQSQDGRGENIGKPQGRETLIAIPGCFYGNTA